MRLGPASQTLDRLAAEGKRFDLAFLDADKTGYLGYYKKAGPFSTFAFACVSHFVDVASPVGLGRLGFPTGRRHLYAGRVSWPECIALMLSFHVD